MKTIGLIVGATVIDLSLAGSGCNWVAFHNVLPFLDGACNKYNGYYFKAECGIGGVNGSVAIHEDASCEDPPLMLKHYDLFSCGNDETECTKFYIQWDRFDTNTECSGAANDSGNWYCPGLQDECIIHDSEMSHFYNIDENGILSYVYKPSLTCSGEKTFTFDGTGCTTDINHDGTSTKFTASLIKPQTTRAPLNPPLHPPHLLGNQGIAVEIQVHIAVYILIALSFIVAVIF